MSPQPTFERVILTKLPTAQQRATPARELALDILRRIDREGAFAGSLLRGARDLLPEDQALATELVYGVLRRRGQLDRALSVISKKRLKDLDPALHDILRLATYQLAFLDRIPAHAAVNDAVHQARQRRGERGAAQTNAILRQMAALEPSLRIPKPTPLATDSVRAIAEAGSVPHALASLLAQDLGAQTAYDFVVASLDSAPLTLRANLLRNSVEDLLAELHGERGSVLEAIRLPSSGTLPGELKAVQEGRATPQDEASMQVVLLLDPQPDEQILDVCAAPGGKTTHIAERMLDRGQVLAHDRLPPRLARVAESAQRLGLQSIRTVDVLPQGQFDRVLVDAPCSGLGTLRRHPEIRWRFSPKDLEPLTQTQAQVLAQGAQRVRPGGVLVYSVCTVTRAEGEAQLEKLSGFTIESILRTGPHQPGAPDGFFAAKLRKM